jgi:microcystin degradation protein MlrC
MSRRVLLAGLFHETHTFLDGVTPAENFAVREGDELLATRGDGSPMAGAVEVAAGRGWELRPVIDLRATPSATAADVVLERFWTAFAAAWQREQSRGIAGVYLVLHGAMVTESCRDVESEVMRRLRALPGGADVPVCGVLDLHGNIARDTMELSDGFIAYRNNPHTDAHAAAVAGAELLDRILSSGQRPACVRQPTPIVWPPTGTGTADDPMKSLQAAAREIERTRPEIAAVNVFGGYSFADTPDTGVSLSAITFGDPEAARAELHKLAALAWKLRESGDRRDGSLAETMPRVLADVAAGRTPVVLVEPADNIGGGAPGDGTSLLRALLAHGIEGAAVVINDPAAVQRCQGVPIGKSVSLEVGGRGSRLGEGPVKLIDAELLGMSDGRFELEDRHSHLASMCGVHVDMGPCATVRHRGVTVVLTSRKTPPFDLGQLRSQGVEPERCTVIGVKAAVAHRQAYDPITAATYTVATPGPCCSDLTTFPYRHIRRPVFPLDADAPGPAK